MYDPPVTPDPQTGPVDRYQEAPRIEREMSVRRDTGLRESLMTETDLGKEAPREGVTPSEIEERDSTRGQADEQALPVVHVCSVQAMKSLEIAIAFELKTGGTLETQGIVDTGAERCIVSTEVLERRAPELLDNLRPLKAVLCGIAGEHVEVKGQVDLHCVVGRRRVFQNFIVAMIKENVIIGLDFLHRYEASWDWLTGELRYGCVDKGTLSETPREENTRVYTALETVLLQPGEAKPVRIGLQGPESKGTHVFLEEPWETKLPEGVTAKAGLIGWSQEEPYLILENRGVEMRVVEEDTFLGQWETLQEVVVNRVSRGMELTETDERERKGPLSDELLQMVQSLPEEVNEHKNDLLKLIREYRSVFAEKGQALGRTGIVKHTIDTGESRPIKQPPRRVPMHQVEIMDTALKEMEEAGVIRPSDSAWSSPVVMVRKKDGTYRFCVDYRKLNSCTRKDAYPLPRIEDNLEAMEGSKWFACLDLASGYWQVEMSEIDKDKTAFTTRYGLWEWNVMPFGLCNAPATFERLMEKVLEGLQWKILVLYLDDIVVFAKNPEQLLERLSQVFSRLLEAGMKLKPKKCDLLKRSVAFLGHVIDGEGIHMDPEKIKVIWSWRTPKDVKDIRIFLGLTSYYRKYVPSYARLAGPMYDLTRNDVEFVWTNNCEKAFKGLKEALVSEPILGYPTPEDSFVLDTDACNNSIGAVLSQIQGEQEVVICYGSRCLLPTEKNYCVTRKELLAIVYFVDYYAHYLLGKEFLIRTDHGSLRWLLNVKDPEGQMARWITRMSRFDYKIEYRPGKKHGNADGVSRRPCEGDCKQCKGKWLSLETEIKSRSVLLRRLNVRKRSPANVKAVELEHVIYLNMGKLRELPAEQEYREAGQHRKTRVLGRRGRIKLVQSKDTDQRTWSEADIARETQEDAELRIVWRWKEDKPPWPEIANMGGNVKALWGRWEQLIWKRGMLWLKWKNQNSKDIWKLVVPQVYRQIVLELLHDAPMAGHFGLKRSASRLITAPVWWVGCQTEMKDYVRKCDLCLRTKPVTKRAKAKMRSFQAGEPMERVAVDILGPIARTERDNLYVVVLVDYFTKWVEIFPLPNHKAVTVAKCLVEKVFSRMGIPKQLHSDQGTDFMSNVFKETCRLLGITQTRTTPWRPQSDGMVERMNRTLEAMLKQYSDDNQGNWDLILPYCAAAYRSSVHDSTGYSPNMMMFGRETRMPIDLLVPHPEEEGEGHLITADMYVDNLKRLLRQAFEIARRNLGKATARQMENYNRKASDKKFEKGMSVWLYNPKRKVGRSPKLDIPWEGPYLIVAVLNDVLLEIQKSPKGKSRVVHQDKVVPTRRQFDGSWVFKLKEVVDPINVDKSLDDIRFLFDTPVEERSTPAAREGHGLEAPAHESIVETAERQDIDTTEIGIPLDETRQSITQNDKGILELENSEDTVISREHALREKGNMKEKWWKRVGHRLTRV